MTLSSMPGPYQPDLEIVMPRDQAVAGLAVGVIVIDISYPLLPGNVANASTFNFPVMYKILKGATIEQIMTGDPALTDLIIEAGQDLISHGVRCIVGACGSFAYFQKQAAAAFNVPTFMSVMLQAPLILQCLRPEQRLGVVTASPEALNQKVYDQCGISDSSRLLLTGAKGLPEFDNVLQSTGRLNSGKLEAELVERVRTFKAEHPEIGAWLIQCSDLPPYAWAIQNATGLPVFDMTNLIEYAYSAVVRQPFIGFI